MAEERNLIINQSFSDRFNDQLISDFKFQKQMIIPDPKPKVEDCGLCGADRKSKPKLDHGFDWATGERRTLDSIGCFACLRDEGLMSCWNCSSFNMPENMLLEPPNQNYLCSGCQEMREYRDIENFLLNEEREKRNKVTISLSGTEIYTHDGLSFQVDMNGRARRID